MATKTFKVPNIHCGHCVMTIEREVGELAGVTSVKAEQATRMVTVNWNEPPATWTPSARFWPRSITPRRADG